MNRKDKCGGVATLRSKVLTVLKACRCGQSPRFLNFLFFFFAHFYIVNRAEYNSEHRC